MLAPAKIVQYLKGRSSRKLQMEYEVLRKRYWGQHMGIDPFAYLRDVLDRISTHPNARIGELTPRGWKAALASPVSRP